MPSLLPLSSAVRAHSPEKRRLTPSSCGPRNGFFLMFAERVRPVENKHFEHVWLYFCIPGSLGHWGEWRGGFIRTQWPSCLQGNPENSACPSSVESTRGQRKVPSVFFQGSSWGIRATTWLICTEIFLIASLTWATVNFSVCGTGDWPSDPCPGALRATTEGLHIHPFFHLLLPLSTREKRAREYLVPWYMLDTLLWP